MINDLEGLNIEEIKTAIEFCKDKFKKTNYIDFCELYDQCDSCPINSQIEEGVDCEQAYLYVKYKYLITEELIEELQEKSWEYCNLDCHNCKLKDIWEGKDDCVTFIDMATDCFKIETEEIRKLLMFDYVLISKSNKNFDNFMEYKEPIENLIIVEG
mgnify:CR=1 FL=1